MWHDKAYHDGARRRRFQLRKQALAEGIDITALEGKIPSGKTMHAEKFLEHAREAVLAYPTLYEHHQQEKVVRWKVYRKEQKALHKLCMQVIGMSVARRKRRDPLPEPVADAYGPLL